MYGMRIAHILLTLFFFCPLLSVSFVIGKRFARQTVGIEYKPLSDSIHWRRYNGQTRAQHPSHFQSHRRLCTLPRRSYHIIVLVEFAECLTLASHVTRSQWTSSIHCAFANATSIPHMFRRFSCSILVSTHHCSNINSFFLFTYHSIV